MGGRGFQRFQIQPLTSRTPTSQSFPWESASAGSPREGLFGIADSSIAEYLKKGYSLYSS
ncbi:hypothetical protein AGMMS49546_00880 [Spirochaetia bacterium]|nr:hypothetical protein AGMMS49546_00880 [Spirochaetia bacterium]